MEKISIYTYEFLHAAERMVEKEKEFTEIALIDKRVDVGDDVRPFVRFYGLNSNDDRMFCIGDLIDVESRDESEHSCFHEGEFEGDSLTVRTYDMMTAAKEASAQNMECVELFFLEGSNEDPPSVSVSTFDIDGPMDVSIDYIDHVIVPGDPRS